MKRSSVSWVVKLASAMVVVSLCTVCYGAGKTGGKWSLSNPHPDPKTEYRMAANEYKKALDDLAMAKASQRIHATADSLGAWHGSRGDRIAGALTGLGGDLAEIGALKQLEIARLRFVRAQSRLEQMGLLPRK